jgi:hypothetical protein
MFPVGWALCTLMHPADPTERDPHKQREYRHKLVEMISRPDVSIDRLKEYWLLGWLVYDISMVVPDKSWDDHRRMIYKSDPHRGRYNVGLALRALQGDQEALDEIDPFRPGGPHPLVGDAYTQADRIWRNRDDYRDPAVVNAVKAVLRSRPNRGLHTVVTAVEARAQAKLDEIEAINKLESTNWKRRIINDFHKELLLSTNAAYQLKRAFETAPPEIRNHIRMTLQGSTLAIQKALDDLLDALISD